ncbi:hypothetical protein AM493_12845 [Flavobacterium akiainvivens]|uniref:Secretion system C-terminal sorting domain-containing protein n=1 Tax=Flavobacterium akiainvivens TaxID=1202724 RepID=A0A0M8MA64_9FLAO|nr:T9SS type A sorting domain-containing protein [Flavobacterium akiainvivens]KOS06813.1 hypothetical protein AM493_12845 [Flavobacterium akiainvivens]SFQ75275.1 Por secretion system C-terminal sorting domain-containing protein [Flavobacterium akiainvivens]
MKKIALTLVLLAFRQMASAQQCPPVALPYEVDAEAATAPVLPDCVFSSNVTFASQEVFETLAGPIPGFDGNVLAFNTIINTEFGMDPSASVGSSLYLRPLLLTQGVSYTISYRYGNSNPDFTISSLNVYLVAQDQTSVTLATQDSITGATTTDFTSQPFTVSASGAYTIMFDAWSTGSQGLFYLDDIVVAEAGAMGLPNQAGANSLGAWPNPVTDVVTVTAGAEPFTGALALYSLTGQKLLEQQPGNGTLNMQGLAAGVYVLSAEAAGRRQTLRIVKE